MIDRTSLRLDLDRRIIPSASVLELNKSSKTSQAQRESKASPQARAQSAPFQRLSTNPFNPSSPGSPGQLSSNPFNPSPSSGEDSFSISNLLDFSGRLPDVDRSRPSTSPGTFTGEVDRSSPTLNRNTGDLGDVDRSSPTLNRNTGDLGDVDRSSPTLNRNTGDLGDVDRKGALGGAESVLANGGINATISGPETLLQLAGGGIISYAGGGGSSLAGTNIYFDAPLISSTYDEFLPPGSLLSYANTVSSSFANSVGVPAEFFLTGFSVTVTMQNSDINATQYIYSNQPAAEMLRLNSRTSGWWTLAIAGGTTLVKNLISVEDNVAYTHIVDFINKSWVISSSVGNCDQYITGTTFTSSSTQTLHIGHNGNPSSRFYFGTIEDAQSIL